MRDAARLPALVVIGMGIVFGWIAAGGPFAGNAAVSAPPEATEGTLDRTVLPIPEPKSPIFTELDVRNVKVPPRFEVKAPAHAPNVLIVLIDDMGFGQSSAFGGPIHMPTVEKLASERAQVQPVSHHGTLFADPGGAAYRSQSSRLQHGLDHGDGDGLPGSDREAARQRGPDGRDASPQRVRNRRLREVSRDRGLGGQRFRARPIAGQLARASTSFTGSSAARPTSGRQRFTTG